MTNLIKFKLSFLLFLFPLFLYSQPNLDVVPGVDRWKIKITAEKFTTNDNAKTVSLKKLLTLPLLDKKFGSDDFNEVLIPKKIGNLQEGQIISTKGYLHLVALERSSSDHQDGDYHIQLTMHSEWGDSCFIVEIPYEEFVSNPELKSLCEKNRLFIRDHLLHNKDKQPSSGGNIMQHDVYVKVTGQLFYDAIHAEPMRNPHAKKTAFRGKKGMHSYTAWEIHPVTNIEFAPKPH